MESHSNNRLTFEEWDYEQTSKSRIEPQQIIVKHDQGCLGGCLKTLLIIVLILILLSIFGPLILGVGIVAFFAALFGLASSESSSDNSLIEKVPSSYLITQETKEDNVPTIAYNDVDYEKEEMQLDETPKETVGYIAKTKAFFYDQPSENTMGNAYLAEGDVIEINEIRNEFGYTVFMNTRGQITKGWIKMSDLYKNSLIDEFKTVSTTTANKLDFLKTFEGKYPHEVKLFDKSEFTQRLKKLIGNSRYDFLIQTWAVETPIQLFDNVFISEGCKAHECDSTNFVIVYDFSTDVMEVGIRENGKAEIYSENGEIDNIRKYAWENW